MSDGYASALVELAQSGGALESVHNDLDGLRSILASSPALRQFLNNPVVRAGESALRDLFFFSLVLSCWLCARPFSYIRLAWSARAGMRSAGEALPARAFRSVSSFRSLSRPRPPLKLQKRVLAFPSPGEYYVLGVGGEEEGHHLQAGQGRRLPQVHPQLPQPPGGQGALALSLFAPSKSRERGGGEALAGGRGAGPRLAAF